MYAQQCSDGQLCDSKYSEMRASIGSIRAAATGSELHLLARSDQFRTYFMLNAERTQLVTTLKLIQSTNENDMSRGISFSAGNYWRLRVNVTSAMDPSVERF